MPNNNIQKEIQNSNTESCNNQEIDFFDMTP